MRFLTAGESHGPCLTAIIEGMPTNVPISREKINRDMARRQLGYGRGGRMKIEKDQVQLLSGVRHGKSLGSPITLQINNKDWENWQDLMSPDLMPEQTILENELKPDINLRNLPKEIDKVVTRPRPGHADLGGALKYKHQDIRNVLERASARETAARVAVGSIVKALLAELEINVFSHVVNIGGVQSESAIRIIGENKSDYTQMNNLIKEIADQIEKSPVFCLDKEKALVMIDAIDRAKKEGDSLGGVVEVMAVNLPPGIGSYVHWDRKLDARLAYSLTSIQAIKGVEFGLGFNCAHLPGSQVHDSIYHDSTSGFFRNTNGAGGIEGGMSNGEPIVVRAVMKPIPTLYKPLASVDMHTKESQLASVERSDTCAVPACSVVAEAVVAWEIAQGLIDKFGGDSLEDLKEQLSNYRAYIREV